MSSLEQVYQQQVNHSTFGGIKSFSAAGGVVFKKDPIIDKMQSEVNQQLNNIISQFESVHSLNINTHECVNDVKFVSFQDAILELIQIKKQRNI